MPSNNQSNHQENEHTNPANLPQPRRSSTSNLYGMILRKTKNKTFRSNVTTNTRDAEQVNDDDKQDSSHSHHHHHCNTSPDENRRTPKIGNTMRFIQPSNSFYFSPLQTNSWDNVNNRCASVSGAEAEMMLYDNYGNVEQVVAGVESSIRKIVICCIFFIAGTTFPEYYPHVRKLLELSLVAWGTCLGIIGLVWFQKIQCGKMYRGQEERVGVMEDDDALGVPELTAPPEIHRSVVVSSAEGATEVADAENGITDSSEEFALTRKPLDGGVSSAARGEKRISPSKTSKVQAFMPPHLKQLEDLYIMMAGTQERLSPNGASVKIETDLFEGEMLLMFRTSDVDDPPPVDGVEDPIRAYFRGKQRRFEWQWQIRLKKVPDGDVYVGCELDEPPAMGMIQRALVNTALKFVKKTNHGFGYYFSDSSDSPSYLSFPVGTSMDRFVATKPGEEVPQLGREIVEDPDAMKKRKRGGLIEWNTEDTYTMALWSAYFDWIEWQILNFPGIRPFSATSVAGVQPIKVNLYTIAANEQDVASGNPQKDVLFELEVSNITKAAMGKEAKVWRSKQASLANASAARVLDFSEPELVENADDENSDNDDMDAEMQILDVPMEPLRGIAPSNYVTSGTCLSLREGASSFLASGGGYALLQSSSTSVIVLEKLFRSKKAFSYIQKSGMVSDPQMVIRNGDVVRVKLVNISSNTTKYLRIYRGWWLRWTSNRPTKTTTFHISTNDPESSALLLGAPFSLRSRKWSSYNVGVCHESSAKYGGRMLAIFKAGKSTAEEEPAIECDDEDDPIEEDDDKDFVAEKPVSTTVPLLLRAEVAKTHEAESPSPSKRGANTQIRLESEQETIQASLDSAPSDLTSFSRCELDCPVWLEVMNRATRSTQLVYAIRVKEISEYEEGSNNVSLKLRTGRDIAPILNLGARCLIDTSTSDESFAWQISNLQVDNDGKESGLTTEYTNSEGYQRTNSFSSSSDESDDEVMDDEQTDYLISGPNDDELSSFTNGLYATVFPEEEDIAEKTTDGELVRQASSVSEDDTDTKLHKTDSKTGDYCNTQSLDPLAADQNATTPKSFVHTDLDGDGKKKTKTKVLNRVAKTVKSSTVITGKQVIKQGKKVRKATVNTGLAAGRVMTNPNKPPKRHEPVGRFSSKKAKNDSMKHVGRAIKNMEGRYHSETHSGQLSAPDHSREKISQILRQLSANKSPSVMDALSSLVKVSSEQDLSFLRGCSAELGVVPLKAIDTETDFDIICARGIWEGRWREECCVIYSKDNHLAFYAPLARKPSLVVTFEEILSVRKCDPKPNSSPLAGLPLISIDTTWRCHYIAFLTEVERENFVKKLNESMYHAGADDLSKHTNKIAQEWESYKMSLEASLTGSGGKWASVMIGKKSKQKRQRMIFNSRRMNFDLEPVVDSRKFAVDAENKMKDIASYVEDLLHKALSFTPESLDSADSSFLDQVSRLKSIPLHEIEYESKQAVCIFVNLYHCLLQHALLFAVDGLPDKRSVTRFKRCSCYEVGGDIFSLAELECCVIRGKLSRPVHLKTPLVDVAKKSRPYLHYALDAADNRVNFYLNTGLLDHPSQVPVLKHETMDKQIQSVTSSFLTKQVTINVKKRVVTIPKVCDVYRNDFGMGDCLVCLSQLLRYLDETNQLLIASLLENGGQITVRFKQPSERFHTHLKERPYESNHFPLQHEASM